MINNAIKEISALGRHEEAQNRLTVWHKTNNKGNRDYFVVFVVVMLFYVYGKHLRSCRTASQPNHTFPG